MHRDPPSYRTRGHPETLAASIASKGKRRTTAPNVGGVAMRTEIDPQMVLARAQARAEADGFAWNLDIRNRGKRLLSEARRRLYIQDPREELNKVIAAVTDSIERKMGNEWLKSLPITVTGLPPTYGTLEQMLIACYRIGELEGIDKATTKASRTD